MKNKEITIKFTLKEIRTLHTSFKSFLQNYAPSSKWAKVDRKILEKLRNAGMKLKLHTEHTTKF